MDLIALLGGQRHKRPHVEGVSVFQGDNMATAAQLTKQMGEMISPTPYRQRMSAKNRRKQIIDAQVSALQKAIEEIRKKAREMPAWAHGYHSAITSIELQIKQLREN